MSPAKELDSWTCQRTSVFHMEEYTGRRAQEQKTLVQHSSNRDRHLMSHGASVRKKTTEGTREWGMQDAHPRIMQERGIPAGAWPGGHCNKVDQLEAQKRRSTTA